MKAQNTRDFLVWQSSETRPTIWAVVGGFLLALLMWRLLKLPLPVLLGVWLVLGVLVYQFLPASVTAVHKQFRVATNEAAGVVAAVLQKKGLPFQAGDAATFYLMDNETAVIIEAIDPHISRIRLTPVQANNQPLVESLCQQIDYAFAARDT
jgi:hypothetical protein